MWFKLLRSVFMGLLVAALLLVSVPSIRPQFVTQWFTHLFNNDEPVSYNKAVRRAAPAVVNVYSSNMGSLSQQGPEMTSLGSGVIMNDQGYILTNQHVIKNADQILIALQYGNYGRLYEGMLIGADDLTDLAVLKINTTDKLPVIPINPKRQSHVGDVVLAIGNPFNVGQTVNQGIISAMGRVGLSPTRRQNFLQTDASIMAGNSGGALVNTEGELVGINTMSYDSNDPSRLSDSIGLAIPAELALRIMNKLIKDGRVIRGYIGITSKELPPIRTNNSDINQITGLRVFQVARDGPADKGGIQVGDIITSVNNKPSTSPLEMMDQVAELSPGSVVPVTLLRNGQMRSVDVTIEEFTPSPGGQE
ncbi:TPA: outer membrane-stress sensor serine endopeptidase DegS [Morganella morganii]|uniref:outer membrane-stress sensor serine endopeptidase DegS n=1 Tax=Morganella morganii TaxID=582 RepID=UPI000F49FB2C|nr:outer membrane-stress sensor serine endopeptidase DegS [Morganella morganii]MBT0379905.1 outer membrane-stress sensor serine endopeptidase DegS [Morganella morganii subsp. morganii]ROJ31069.1 outer membrane-stress sensor serine endopeptidase DegS [Morganella morganii]HDU8608849.1 outer membrane-stress sensor serine endopeptidase DegS [Morganella morganii]